MSPRRPRRRTSSTACAASRRAPGALPGGRRGRRAAHRVADLGNWSGAADNAAPAESPRADDAARSPTTAPGRRPYLGVPLPEPDRAEAPPTTAARRRRHEPARAPTTPTTSAPAATPALLTVADLGDWSGAADDAAPVPTPPSSPSEASCSLGRRPARARCWSLARTLRRRRPFPRAGRPRRRRRATTRPTRTTSRTGYRLPRIFPGRRRGVMRLGIDGLGQAARSPRRSTATRTSGFRAATEAANADGTYAVADDGDREPRVDAAFVRVVLHGGARRRRPRGAPTRRRATTRPPGPTRRRRAASRPRAASSASSPRRASGCRFGSRLEYSEDFADDDAARNIDDQAVGAQRAAPRAPAATRDDAAAAAASAAATQRALARVEKTTGRRLRAPGGARLRAGLAMG